MARKTFSAEEKKAWKEKKETETRNEMEALVEDLLNSENVHGFLNKKLFILPDTVPSTKWSLLNQFRMYKLGTMDARGFDQWKKVGRFVKKGCKSKKILVPVFGEEEEKNEDTGKIEAKKVLKYFKGVSVFAVEDTKGDDLDYMEELKEYEERKVDNLPLLDIAEKMDIPVNYSMTSGGEYGSYHWNGLTGEATGIKLCTDAEQTFYHELAHAIDHKVNANAFGKVQSLDEITAEFTACYLAGVYGKEANMLYTRNYVQSWSKQIKPVDKLFKCLERALNIVMYIAEMKEG
jgi:hypothetical protein